MKKRMLTIMMAGVLSTSLVIPAMAETGGEAVPVTTGTEVYAGIMLKDPDAKIKVEVPTLFAFVVNGSVATSDTGAVTSADGKIMLPNVKVAVNTPSGAVGGATGNAAYSIQTVGESNLKFTNYSTVKAGTDERAGLAVKISGAIKNEGTDVSRNYWTHVANATSSEGEKSGFKQYTLSVGDKKFNKAKDGGFAMEEAIALPAPNLGKVGTGATATYSNMDDTTKLALTGATTAAVFNVNVGGQQNQYKQVEESAKVGTIVWTIGAEVTADDVYTAPDNEYLDGTNSGVTTDPDGIVTTAPTP